MSDIPGKGGGVWIEAISVHVPYHTLSHKTLAEATGQDPAKFTSGLGCHQMALCHPTQDSVTMACEAAGNLFESWGVDPRDVGMIIVATETAVDWAKPIATYVHQALKITSNCRIFDVQHACFGASAALACAVSWVGSGMSRGKKALVVATDIARYEVDSPGEATQGAGSVAMIVGEGHTGVLRPDFSMQAIYGSNVMDFWRPAYRSTAVVDGKYSVQCYLKALSETYKHCRRGGGPGYGELKYLLFHLPFTRMSWKALQSVVRAESELTGGGSAAEEALQEIYDGKVYPGTIGAREVGNIYSGSLYLSLASLLETEKDCAAGERIGLFSYGSGSCAEFFIGTVGDRREIWEGKIGLMDGIARRKPIDYRTYLDFRKETGLFAGSDSFHRGYVPLADRIPPDARYLFLGYKDHVRMYTQGPAAGVGVEVADLSRRQETT